MNKYMIKIGSYYTVFGYTIEEKLMSDKKVPSGIDGSNTSINNELKDVSIGGAYVGGDLNAKYYLNDKSALEVTEHLEFQEQFGIKAAEYISKVAVRISEQNTTDEINDLGLDDEKLNNKFSNMKCSPSYRKWFNEYAAIFPTINQLRESDSFEGRVNVVRGVVDLIRQLYFQALDLHDNGDKIHNSIFSHISKHTLSEEEAYATHSLIFFVINECGIFNEKK